MVLARKIKGENYADCAPTFNKQWECHLCLVSFEKHQATRWLHAHMSRRLLVHWNFRLAEYCPETRSTYIDAQWLTKVTFNQAYSASAAALNSGFFVRFRDWLNQWVENAELIRIWIRRAFESVPAVCHSSKTHENCGRYRCAFLTQFKRLEGFLAQATPQDNPYWYTSWIKWPSHASPWSLSSSF